MKTILTLTLFIPLLSFCQNEEADVKEIRTWYKEVESNLKNCIKIPVTMFYDEDYVTGGSTDMEGYYDTINKEIIKIVEHTYYDWSEDVASYYFKNGKLFFVFQTGYSPGEMYTAEELKITEDELWEMGGEAKTLNHYEDRYYYKNDTCIRYLNKTKEIDADQTADLKDVENKKGSIIESSAAVLKHHGYKMLKQFNRQLPKK